MEDYARFVLERAKAGGRAPSQNADHRAAADLGEAETVLSGEQQASQEARFAARKAAKKRRRRGY
jgi:hypothetical protein